MLRRHAENHVKRSAEGTPLKSAAPSRISTLFKASLLGTNFMRTKKHVNFETNLKRIGNDRQVHKTNAIRMSTGSSAYETGTTRGRAELSNNSKGRIAVVSTAYADRHFELTQTHSSKMGMGATTMDCGDRTDRTTRVVFDCKAARVADCF